MFYAEIKQSQQEFNRLFINNDGYNLKFIRNFGRVFDNKDELVVELKRYLKGEHYALKIGYQSQEKLDFRISIQINNKVVFDSKKEASRPGSWAEIIVNNANFKFPKNKPIPFSEVNHIVVTAHQIFGKKLILRQALQILFQSNKIKKDYILGDTSEIVFRSKRIISEDKISYNNILLKPIRWEVGKNNNKLFDIFAWNDNGEPIDFDLNLKTGELTGLPIKDNRGLETSFIIDSDFKLNSNLHRQLLGSIYILNNTYFDYFSGLTTKGNQFGAKQGYIIPFFFRGFIYPRLKISLNSSFQDLEITRSSEFKKSLFGVSKAFFSLKISKANQLHNFKLAWQRLNLESLSNLEDGKLTEVSDER